MSETQLKIKAIKHLKKLQLQGEPIWFFKVSDRFTSGIPDIIMCYNGRFVAIELKKPTGVVSPLQRFNLDAIGKTNGFPYLCNDFNDFKVIMETLKKNLT